jgi:carboxymethylenebutenolidase
MGGADESITPADIAIFDEALSAAGIAHELHTYEGAPHSFFDRAAQEYGDASADAWERVLEFIAANR